MTIADALKVAWQATTRRRLRSILTAASLMIGVLTLVVVQSAESLVHQATLHRAILRNGPAATLRLQLGPQGGPDQGWWRERVERLTAGQEARVSVYNGYSSVNLAGISVDLTAVDAELTRIRPFQIVRGSWLTETRLAPQLVLNRAAAAAVSLDDDPVLQAPEGFGGLRVTIVGVVDDGDPAPNAYVAPGAEAALQRSGILPTTRSILVSAQGMDRDRLASRVATIATLTGHEGDVQEVSRVDTVADFDDQLAMQRRIFLAIAVLCLLVGSLGILNIGLSTLRERAEELSLRRALGASRLTIATIMMLESQLVAVLAAVLAIVAAQLAVPWFMGSLTTVAVDSPHPPLAVLALGVLASAAAALAGAVAPSLRAARVPIATLLR